MHRYRRLLAYAVDERRSLVAILVLTLATSCLTALQPWPLKVLIDYALAAGGPPATLAEPFGFVALPNSASALIVIAAVATLVLVGLNSLVVAGLTWTWAAAGQRMVYDLAADLVHRLQRVSLSVHGRRPIGDSLVRVTDDTWCVYTVTEALLVTPLQQLATIGAVGIIAWRLDPPLAMTSLAVAPVLAALAVVFGSSLKRRAVRDREARSRLAAFVQQTIAALPIVQAFGSEDRNRREFERAAVDTVARSQQDSLLRNVFTLVNGAALAVGMAAVLYVGGRRVLAGQISIGTLLVFVAYMESLRGAAQSLMGTYGRLRSAGARIDRVFEAMGSEQALPELPGAAALPVAGNEAGRHILFENVTFGFEADRPVLRDVGLEIESGETLALVGPSGAGKTTLVSLILRLFDPWRGRVLIDGADVRRVKLASVREQVAIVLQEPFLLPLSVAENIAYGRPRATPEEIAAAAVAANADRFIRALPQGYDTPLAEGAADLSGGQRQRIAIARALLKDAPILILDEPTSALDPGTERSVMEALDRLTAGRTTIIIAHRLSTARRADRIAVMEDGRVTATGSHEELGGSSACYRELCAHQLLPVAGPRP